MKYLDLEDLLQAAEIALRGQPGIRDVGLIESALARPQASAFGEDAYPDVFTKAAALLHSLVKNHPFVDGNKRVALAAATSFLWRNGYRLAFTQDAAYDFVIGVATGDLDEVAEIAAVLKTSTSSR